MGQSTWGRSRSLPHQRGNTLSGLEDPSWLPCPPSNRCGSLSRNMTSLAQPLSTGNASKLSSKLSKLSTTENETNCKQQIRNHCQQHRNKSSTGNKFTGAEKKNVASRPPKKKVALLNRELS